MMIGSLEGHIQTHNGRAAEGRRSWASTTPGEEHWTYRMAFPTAGGTRTCPVKGCPGRAEMRTAMGVHFIHRNFRDTVVIF